MNPVTFPSERNASVLWLLLFVGFFLGAFSKQLIWLMALFGVLLAWRNTPQLWRLPEWRQLLLWLALVLIPGLIAMIDAVDPGRAFRTWLRLLSYGFAALILFSAPLPAAKHGRFLVLTGAAVAFFLLDGVLQFFLGTNLGGEVLYDDLRYGARVTGFLGVDYGWVVAVLSPFLLEGARRLDDRGRLYWLALPLLFWVLLLSGSRTSLMLATLGVLGYGALLGRQFGSSAVRMLLGPLVVGLVVPGLFIGLDPNQSERWVAAAGVFSLDAAAINEALSLRPELWRAAVLVAQDNWLNGVGLRGFGIAAKPILASVEGLPGKAQGWAPHATILEFAADLGVIGLAGYCALYLGLMRSFWSGPDAAAIPYLGALLALFPLGSTLPVFSMRVAGIAWMLLAMGQVLAYQHRVEQESVDQESPPCAG